VDIPSVAIITGSLFRASPWKR